MSSEKAAVLELLWERLVESEFAPFPHDFLHTRAEVFQARFFGWLPKIARPLFFGLSLFALYSFFCVSFADSCLDSNNLVLVVVVL